MPDWWKRWKRLWYNSCISIHLLNQKGNWFTGTIPCPIFLKCNTGSSIFGKLLMLILTFVLCCSHEVEFICIWSILLRQSQYVQSPRTFLIVLVKKWIRLQNYGSISLSCIHLDCFAGSFQETVKKNTLLQW